MITSNRRITHRVPFEADLKSRSDPSQSPAGPARSAFFLSQSLVPLEAEKLAGGEAPLSRQSFVITLRSLVLVTAMDLSSSSRLYQPVKNRPSDRPLNVHEYLANMTRTMLGLRRFVDERYGLTESYRKLQSWSCSPIDE